VGSVMAGLGDAARKLFRVAATEPGSILNADNGRYFARTFASSTTLMLIALVGHACTHAGASPTAIREWHMSHLRTIPRAFEYCGTSYGHIITQYWQPMHWSSRCRTMPVCGSLSYASTGQPFT